MKDLNYTAFKNFSLSLNWSTALLPSRIALFAITVTVFSRATVLLELMVQGLQLMSGTSRSAGG